MLISCLELHCPSVYAAMCPCVKQIPPGPNLRDETRCRTPPMRRLKSALIWHRAAYAPTGCVGLYQPAAYRQKTISGGPGWTGEAVRGAIKYVSSKSQNSLISRVWRRRLFPNYCSHGEHGRFTAHDPSSPSIRDQPELSNGVSPPLSLAFSSHHFMHPVTVCCLCVCGAFSL